VIQGTITQSPAVLRTNIRRRIGQLQRDRRTAKIGEQLDIDGQIRGLRWARKEAEKIR
jgi:hypothetical protein